MNTIFDRETTLKALRDAARIAREGTREEKSGKFLPRPAGRGIWSPPPTRRRSTPPRRKRA